MAKNEGGLRFREDKGWDYTKSGDIGNESWVCADDVLPHWVFSVVLLALRADQC